MIRWAEIVVDDGGLLVVVVVFEDEGWFVVVVAYESVVVRGTVFAVVVGNVLVVVGTVDGQPLLKWSVLTQ